MYWSCFEIILTVLIWWSSINPLTTIAFSNNATLDRLALLAFKEKINNDPFKSLSLWNDSIHYCNWTGITCSRRHRDRVTVLDLQSQKLEGTFSPHIGNLSFLREIKLDTNNFHGSIPQEIGRLTRLRVLSLANNSFGGEIPTNLSHCSNLRLIVLYNNKISGGIPIDLTSLSKLDVLNLDKNELKGNIPSFLGNLSSLTILALEENIFTGTIPEDLCHIQRLNTFTLYSNNLVGTVPVCLYNLSHIERFAVTENQLHGSLPLYIGLTLPNLRSLLVGLNKFSGLIPSSFANASRLEILELGDNQFDGQVPRDLGRLQALRHVSLYSNQLGSTLGDDLNFITSLTNCSNLQVLDVSNNSLKGSMPNSITNLSTQIKRLHLGLNQVYGSFPANLGNLVNLDMLSFEYNYLTGEIPEVIGTFSKIRELYLESNQFSGKIPDSFQNLTLLTILNLAENKLNGRIPPSLGHCKSLFSLGLSNNKISGTIPEQVLRLPSLKRVLDLSNNALIGSLPSEVGNLSDLEALYLSNNRLSGHIPSTIGNCLTLEYLLMDHNYFEGNIPQSLSTLKGIIQLNVSHNKLVGEIPEYLANFTSLTQLDLSYNDLEGPVPKGGIFANASRISLIGNFKLCGGEIELKLQPCHFHRKGKSSFLKVVIPVIFASACLILLSCTLFICYRRRMSKAKPSSPSLSSEKFTRISYAELLTATNGFSVDNLIGIGSYGSVYKGVLAEDNTTIAVKVFNLQQRGASKSFLAECNALRNLRHRNLLKIITACSSVDFQGNDFKALVFEFMPNGSLEEWLHPEKYEQHESKILTFKQRLNIAIDVAYALDYLHNYCQPNIVHRDLKPSNILLDNDMTAHVADFGLAKIVSATSHNSSLSQSSSLVIGSIGYVAPEYGMGGEASMQGDIYSYGVMLLELFTGRRPTDVMFQDGLNLHGLAKTALPEKVMDIVDPTLVLDDTVNQSSCGARVQECLASVTRLGIVCSAESPVERLNIGEVISELLYHIRELSSILQKALLRSVRTTREGT